MPLPNRILAKIDLEKGSLWKIVKLDKPVGFNLGELTNWLRVEVSGGAFHGLPLNAKEVADLLKKAKDISKEVGGLK